jgi:hypothetical protein
MIDNSGLMKEDRREQRFIVDSIILPFLGTRVEDHVGFQYLLVDMSYHGIRIALPKWLVSRDRMDEGTLVCMHIPFRMNKRIFTHGKIVWTRWDETSQAQLCGIHLEEKGLDGYPVFVSLENGEVTIDLKDFDSKEGLLLKVLKDTFLLKKGVLVYIKHLIPYFTRITDYPTEDYARLKDAFLNDVFSRVRGNGERLKSLYERLQREARLQEDIAAYLDLEDLRDMVES